MKFRELQWLLKDAGEVQGTDYFMEKSTTIPKPLKGT
jgi:hypothetical protein